MVDALRSLRDRAHDALEDAGLRASVRYATGIMVDGRLRALAGLENADELRDAARDIRAGVMARLPEVLDDWSSRVEAAGGKVHWARDAREAVATVLEIVRANGGRVIAKGKSMASEEIHLNPALEADGREVVETDLGEFIIQLAGETPSHLIAPAIHKNRYDVADLFTDDAAPGPAIEPDIGIEAAYARKRLRDAFLAADIGITGVNFAVAETGSIVLIENEGNGRMCTSLPKVHIAIMGMERIVATWDELDVMLALLARSATGQLLSVYTNILTGPRRAGELDGPDELHVVVLDNGRSGMRESEFSDALHCIRCGACLNVCPVYRQIGGHAYGSVYAGPIGAVLTPLLDPTEADGRQLSEASSLCGACWDVCPVRIPLHDLLLGLRRRDAPRDAGRAKRVGFRVWSWLWASRVGFSATVLAARPGLWLAARLRLRNGPGWMGAWLRTRDAPRLPRSRR